MCPNVIFIFAISTNAGHALLHPSTALILGIREDGSLPFISLADGSDCVISVTLTATTVEGTLVLTPTQQYNLHAKEGTKAAIKRFNPPPDEPFTLVDIDLEVSLLPGSKDNSENEDGGEEEEEEEKVVKPYILDASKLSQHFLKAYLGLIVANNEACVFSLSSCIKKEDELSLLPVALATATADGSREAQLVLRVRACNTLDQDTAADTVGYHCYRGIVTPETDIYLTLASPQHTTTTTSSTPTIAAAAPPPPLELTNARLRPLPGANEHLIDIYTNDGEYFPVHRKLLRPCIALTKAVRTPGPDVTAAVDIDTLTFDRVLIFLEAHVLNKPLPSFGIHLVPPLKEAAEKLQLGSLVEWCETRLGDSASRRKWHSYSEIEKRNTPGEDGQQECLLTMDGMVFDVTNWLSEHPGGSTIIPAQALNIDSCRFFELYHASRESFIYLREFYIGEILPSDREAVPRSDVEPSDDFLVQLRHWTAEFRLEEGQAAAVAETSEHTFKSF
jgi:hypothetical protein